MLKMQNLEQNLYFLQTQRFYLVPGQNDALQMLVEGHMQAHNLLIVFHPVTFYYTRTIAVNINLMVFKKYKERYRRNKMKYHVKI